MGKLIVQILGSIIIYVITYYGLYYIAGHFFGYSPSGIMHLLFYILIGLLALTIEKIMFSEYKGHFIATLVILGMSILFYYM